jgi:hypothetical protein
MREGVKSLKRLSIHGETLFLSLGPRVYMVPGPEILCWGPR